MALTYQYGEWCESANGNHTQQGVTVYLDGVCLGEFLIRRYGDYDWSAVNLTLRKSLGGMIIAQGQSDTDCLSKANEVIELWFS